MKAWRYLKIKYIKIPPRADHFVISERIELLIQ